MGSGRCAQFCQLHPLPEPESLPLLLLLLLHRALWRPLTGDMGSGRCAQFCQLHPLPKPESLPSWIPSCADLWLSLPFLSEVNQWVAHGVQMPIQQNARTFDRENKSPSHHLPFVCNEVQRMIRLGVIIIPEETVHNTAATVTCSPPPPPPPPPPPFFLLSPCSSQRILCLLLPLSLSTLWMSCKCVWESQFFLSNLLLHDHLVSWYFGVYFISGFFLLGGFFLLVRFSSTLGTVRGGPNQHVHWDFLMKVG